MLLIACLFVATVAFMLMVPRRRRPNEPFDWNKGVRWRRWRARRAFPNHR
jgi:hypothetical protein